MVAQTRSSPNETRLCRCLCGGCASTAAGGGGSGGGGGGRGADRGRRTSVAGGGGGDLVGAIICLSPSTVLKLLCLSAVTSSTLCHHQLRRLERGQRDRRCRRQRERGREAGGAGRAFGVVLSGDCVALSVDHVLAGWAAHLGRLIASLADALADVGPEDLGVLDERRGVLTGDRECDLEVDVRAVLISLF